jgi:hypothetical protein
MFQREEYLCRVCNKRFATRDAVDGYPLGFKEGFLCPHCHSNLKEAGESDDIDHLEYGYSFAILSFFIFVVSTKGWLQFHWFDSSHLNELVTAFVLWLPLLIIFIAINLKALIGTRTVYTLKIRTQK